MRWTLNSERWKLYYDTKWIEYRRYRFGDIVQNWMNWWLMMITIISACVYAMLSEPAHTLYTNSMAIVFDFSLLLFAYFKVLLLNGSHRLSIRDQCAAKSMSFWRYFWPIINNSNNHFHHILVSSHHRLITTYIWVFFLVLSPDENYNNLVICCPNDLSTKHKFHKKKFFRNFFFLKIFEISQLFYLSIWINWTAKSFW